MTKVIMLFLSTFPPTVIDEAMPFNNYQACLTAQKLYPGYKTECVLTTDTTLNDILKIMIDDKSKRIEAQYNYEHNK